MADDTSIFGVLSPEPEDTSLRGMFSNSIRGLSDMFQQAIPKLISDPEVGAGETFAAGFFGGLGMPARQREAERAGQEKTARQLLNALPGILPRMDEASQTRVLQELFPGAQAAVPEGEEDAATKELRTKMLNTFLDPKAPREMRERAREVYAQITPKAAEAARSFILEIPGVEEDDLTPAVTGAYINGLLEDFTETSVQKYLDKYTEGDHDLSYLKRRTKPADPAKAKAMQVSGAINQIRTEQEKALREEDKSLTVREAGERLKMPQVDILAVEKELGVPTTTAGALTSAKLFQIAERRAVENTPNLKWESYAAGEYSEETMDMIQNKALQMYNVLRGSFTEAGIPIYDTAPSLRSGAVQVNREEGLSDDDMTRAAAEVERRQADGDSRPWEVIAREVMQEFEGE